MLSPKQISASDGAFTKYVLVNWKSPGDAKKFQVFRSPDEKVENAKPLNEKLLESSWVLDYAVTPGIKYYYWVKAEYQMKQTSPYSNVDDGFAAKVEKTALDLEAGLESDPDNFTPNPFLEPMINDTRSTDLSIELSLPQIAQKYVPAPDLILFFEGTINMENQDVEKIQLHIYNNTRKDFIDDMPLVKTAIYPQILTNSEDDAFRKEIPFPFPAGLYYYSILLEGEDEPIMIGKFSVEE